MEIVEMEIVEKRGGDRKVLPVTDEVLTNLQNMADTFYKLKVIPKKIDVKDKSYNWFPEQKS
jgi:sulfonate transport system substrate-binding protein